MKNLPLIIAIAGGALAFLLWKQREAKAAVVTNAARQVSREYVPQEWIESTPEGYGVIGTTGSEWDILT